MRRIVMGGVALVMAIAPVARAEHVESYIGPGEPVRQLPADFARPIDLQSSATLNPWTDNTVGGWGWRLPGDAACDTANGKRPVFFVHGTTEDGFFWHDPESGETIVDVRARFIAEGAYCPEQLWAISYDGAPGYFTYNDVNTAELNAFIAEARRYMTERGVDATEIDVISHSLGVTVVRKAATLDGSPLKDGVVNFIAIAGANHGTTACRGVGTAHGSHVCEEVEPGSTWLAQLNAAGEDALGDRVLTMYSSSPSVDQFYLGPDELSPQLAGACNKSLGAVAHNTLARGLRAVRIQLAFLGGTACEELPQ